MTQNELITYLCTRTRIAIIGGYLRDSVLGYIPKDIDIITEKPIIFEESSRNRFNGSRLELSDGFSADIWCVNNHKVAGVNLIDFDDIYSHLLLNVWACVYYPQNGRFVAAGLYDAITRNEIDLMYETPISRELVRKASGKIKVLADRYGFRLSERLAELIKEDE
ncbi:hypothetical protein [Bacillus altitudinis]|uniref:hypothetical protein n=1 Tax=Bacillus altitudinis TaxID=293387 RepID=UPI00372B33A4